jgi:hypothetical protein
LPKFWPLCSSPDDASARSCSMFCMPTPRSTTTKQLERCAKVRSSDDGEPSW